MRSRAVRRLQENQAHIYGIFFEQEFATLCSSEAGLINRR